VSALRPAVVHVDVDVPELIETLTNDRIGRVEDVLSGDVAAVVVPCVVAHRWRESESVVHRLNTSEGRECHHHCDHQNVSQHIEINRVT